MKPVSLVPKKQTQQAESTAVLDIYWTVTTDQPLFALHTTLNVTQQADAESRLKQYRPNTL